jgi:hypothetical protein
MRDIVYNDNLFLIFLIEHRCAGKQSICFVVGSSCISIALRSALLALEANGAAGRKRRDAEALTAKIVAVLKQVNFPTVADELDGFLAPLDDGAYDD